MPEQGEAANDEEFAGDYAMTWNSFFRQGL
jgi:hypothetical protein